MQPQEKIPNFLFGRCNLLKRVLANITINILYRYVLRKEESKAPKYFDLFPT